MSPTNVNYLRISVTDSCNLHCVYCNPFHNNEHHHRDDILSFDELDHLVRLCAKCGITRVRLTGGEPLLRENLVDLIHRISKISAIEDVSLTTNGIHLAPIASQLKQAGLKRVNISLDAFDKACYKEITGCDMLPAVLNGIHKAIDVGLVPVRINCVVLREINLEQIPRLARMSLDYPVSVRFIEYYPTEVPYNQIKWYVPNQKVRKVIESELGPLAPFNMVDKGGPAEYFQVKNAMGTIGFISGRSSYFCQRCSRLRITSDGRFRPCLHSCKYYDVKELLRGGADDELLLKLIRDIIEDKKKYTRLGHSYCDLSMRHIGG